MFTECLQSGYFPVTYCSYNGIKVRRKITGEVMVLLESFRKMVMILFLLAAVLTVGCAAGQSPSAAPGNASEEKEIAAEQPPSVAPESESEVKITTSGQQSLVPEQSGSTSAEQPPVQQEKPLVIVSENLILTDRGQLLQALDKEMETLLILLETMDEIQDEDFNF